jgi:hypothetical protein
MKAKLRIVLTLAAVMIFIAAVCFGVQSRIRNGPPVSATTSTRSSERTSTLPLGVVNDALPFNMVASSTLSASPHKVFGWYVPDFPISIDNKPSDEDYYTTQYLNPEGEGGKHAAYGGFLRERPLPRPVDLSANWQLDDMETEVSRASAAGLDGFIYDLFSISTSSPYWTRLQLLIQAADASGPNFKIMLAPDGSSIYNQGLSAAALAGAIAGVANHPGVLHLSDGSLVISSFAPEEEGAAWWQSWINIMQNQYGIKVDFVPVFVNDTVGNTDAFAPFSYGLSNWGNRSPSAEESLAANIDTAHALGKIWMQPVAAQDERPYAGIYLEADNTENFRDTWNAAISDGADWVMFPTWNDYSENTEISPSTGIGWSFLDLASYYLTRFKTGEWPAIVRDVIYVSHRVQFANTPPETSGGKTSLMRLVSAPASSPSRDDVEVLSFLTATSTIEVDIGGSTQQVVASAGESASLSPLAPGQISAQVVRNGQVITSVASPYIVQTSFPIQDESYRIVSSGRDGSTFVNTTPPTAIITSPETSATVSGEIPVAVTAYDDVGVTKVELYVDGNLVATTTTVPYDFTIDTTSLSKGTHILQAQAYDAAANIGTSPSVSVTVSSLVDLRRPRRGSRLSFELRPEEKGNDLPFTWITPGSARAALCGCFSGTSGRAAGRQTLNFRTPVIRGKIEIPPVQFNIRWIMSQLDPTNTRSQPGAVALSPVNQQLKRTLMNWTNVEKALALLVKLPLFQEAVCYVPLSEPILTFPEPLPQKGADLLLSDTYPPFISAGVKCMCHR